MDNSRKLNTKATGVIALAVMCSRVLGLVREVLSRLPAGDSPAADLVRKDFKVRMGGLTTPHGAQPSFGADYEAAYRIAISAARTSLIAIRNSGEIGDDAFHALENELDWMEVSDPLRGANAE